MRTCAQCPTVLPGVKKGLKCAHYRDTTPFCRLKLMSTLDLQTDCSRIMHTDSEHYAERDYHYYADEREKGELRGLLLLIMLV